MTLIRPSLSCVKKSITMKKQVDHNTRMIPFRIKFGGRYIVNTFIKVPKDYACDSATHHDRKRIQCRPPAITKVDIRYQVQEEQSTIPHDSVSNIRHSSALKRVREHPFFKKVQTPKPKKIVLLEAETQLPRLKPQERKEKKIKSHVKSAASVESGSDCSRDSGVAAVYRKLGVGLMDALSKVADEVQDNYIIRDAVLKCNPKTVAVAVQKEMFALIARTPENKANNAKIRSIMFNLKDPSNTDLRRKVLLGEIKPSRLLTMTSEEMASAKRRMENEQIRHKFVNAKHKTTTST